MSDIQLADIATDAPKGPNTQPAQAYDPVSAFNDALAKFKNEPPPSNPMVDPSTATIQTDATPPLMATQQPFEVQQQITAANQLAKLTGLDPGYVYQNMDTVSAAVYGKDAPKGPSLWDRVGTTYNYIKDSNQLRQLYAYQSRGDKNPLIQEQIDSIKKSMPNPDRGLGGIPTQLGQMVYDAIASVGSGVKEAIPEAQGLAQSILQSSQDMAAQVGPGPGQAMLSAMGVASSAAWLAMDAVGGSFVRSVQSMNDQAVGEVYGSLMDMRDEKKRQMDPKIAGTISQVMGTTITALFGIPIAKIPIVSKLIEKALTKATVGLVAGGGFKALAGGFIRSYGQTLNETTLMGLAQAATSVIGTAVAKNLNNSIDKTNFTQDDMNTIVKQLGGGALTGLEMGAVFGFAPALAAGIKTKNMATVLKMAEQAKNVELTANRKPPEEPISIVRHVIESETADTTTAHYRVTDKAGNEIGSIKYTDSPSGIKIQDPTLTAATKDIGTSHDLVVKFMKENQNQKITWDPDTAAGKALKEQLIRENPRKGILQDRIDATNSKITELADSIKNASEDARPKIQEKLDAAKIYAQDLNDRWANMDLQWFADDNTVGDVLNKQDTPTRADNVVNMSAQLRSAKSTLTKLENGAKVDPAKITEAKAAVENARAALKQAQNELKANIGYKTAENKLVTQIEVGKAKAELKRQMIDAKERQAQRGEVTKMINYLKEVDTSKLDPKYKNPINELKDEYNYVRYTKKTQGYLSQIADELRANPEAQFSEYDIGRLTSMSKVNARDLTIDELKTVYNAVRHLEALDAAQKRVIVRGEALDRKIVAEDSRAELPPASTIEEEVRRALPTAKQRVRGVGNVLKEYLGLQQFQYDKIVSDVAGEGSKIYDVLGRQVNDGHKRAKKYIQNVQDAFAKDTEKLSARVKDIETWLLDEMPEVTVESDNVSVPINLRRGERLEMYMHSLNPDNREALLKGGFGLTRRNTRGHYRNRVYNLTETMLYDLTKDLTPDEKVFVHAVQNLFEKQGIDIGKAFFDKNNYEIPILKNYYLKAVMAAARGSTVELDAIREGAQRQFKQAAVSKGHVTERVGSKKPIQINDIGHTVRGSTDWAAQYLHLDSPVMNAARLLNDIGNELDHLYGESLRREIRAGLADAIGQYEAPTKLENAMRTMRGNMTTATLMMNVKGWLLQPISLVRYWAYVDAKYLTKGVMNDITNGRATEKTHREWSPLYRSRREEGGQKETFDAMKVSVRSKAGRIKEQARGAGMTPYNVMDATAVRPGMQASLYQFIDHAKNGKLTKHEKWATGLTNEEAMKLSGPQLMKSAYQFADYVTERTQTQSSALFQAPLQRGSQLSQIFTMFGSETNSMLNMAARLISEANRTKKASDWARAGKAIFALTFEQAAYFGLTAAQAKLLGQAAPTAFDMITGSVTQFWYGLRDIQYAVTQALKRGASVQLIPLERYATVLANGIGNFIKAANDKTETQRKKALLRGFDNIAEFTTTAMGLPYYNVKKWVALAVKEIKSGD